MLELGLATASQAYVTFRDAGFANSFDEVGTGIVSLLSCANSTGVHSPIYSITYYRTTALCSYREPKSRRGGARARVFVPCCVRASARLSFSHLPPPSIVGRVCSAAPPCRVLCGGTRGIGAGGSVCCGCWVLGARFCTYSTRCVVENKYTHTFGVCFVVAQAGALMCVYAYSICAHTRTPPTILLQNINVGLC